MEQYKLEAVSFTYPDRDHKALDNIDLIIRKGEFVTVCGGSGSGKTTLLRLLKPAVAPFGTVDGNIYFESAPLCNADARSTAEKIGLVMQDPDAQTVTDKVWHELAFGLESLGLPNSEIRARVAETASFFGIEYLFRKKINELSGGQKQLVALAAVMVMRPEVLILDEPTARLDPIAAESFVNTLIKINRELGTTIIISEHCLEEVLPVSDAVAVMDKGRMIAYGTPREVCAALCRAKHFMYGALPAPARVYGSVENGSEYPLTVHDGRMWLDNYSDTHTLLPERIPTHGRSIQSDPAIELKGVSFRYSRTDTDVLSGLDMSVSKGEIFALLGGNGSGKTTLLSVISGLYAPYRGQLLINGEKASKSTAHPALLPQDPKTVFLKKTVRGDIEDVLSAHGIPAAEKAEKARVTAAFCGVEEFLDLHPYDLSGGEQQRAALAVLLAVSPDIILLDEPTKGYDPAAKEQLKEILQKLSNDGATIIIVSHDIEFCAGCADRCALLFDGHISALGTPGELFTKTGFYTTASARMARTVLPYAILAEDIILACGCEPPSIPKADTYNKKSSEASAPTGEKKKNTGMRTLLCAIPSLIAVPLTVFAGMRFFGDRKYYFISILIILETLIPFGISFEKRRPKASELVIISVICAFAVAGRAAFFAFPEVKPMLAVIIIAGACLGAETGFLCGAVTAFISNFIFGQGPWTPWQMFALGISGFLPALLHDLGIIKKKRIPLALSGFVTAVVIYGGIMNSANVFMSGARPTLPAFAASCAAGLPYDLIHAASTAFFIYFLADHMTDTLERVKQKYGIMR